MPDELDGTSRGNLGTRYLYAQDTNQKNGWRGVCINHHTNSDPNMCPVRVIVKHSVNTIAHKSITPWWLTEEQAQMTEKVRR